MRRPRSILLSLSVLFCTWPVMQGCTCQDEVTALAALEPLGDANARGTIEFSALAPERTRIRAQLSGLLPGLHGIHIHEFGDCSAPDGASAGDHFNPDGITHGGLEGPKHHAGDLGNIRAGQDGRAVVTLTSESITLDDGPRGVLGRSVVVHALADDLVTDPAGNSGARIACAVIRLPTGTTQPVLPGP